MSRAEVSWKGDGVWEPESMCFDWTNDDFKVKEDFWIYYYICIYTNLGFKLLLRLPIAHLIPKIAKN